MIELKKMINNTQPTLVGLNELTPSLTLLALDAALVNDKLELIDSFEPALLNPDGGIPGPECITQEPGLCFDGDLLTFETGANKPKFGRHSKYLKETIFVQSSILKLYENKKPYSVDRSIIFSSRIV